MITDNNKNSGFAAFKIIAFTHLFIPLPLPQGVFLYHRSWLVVVLLLLFSPIFAPVGEVIYSWIARTAVAFSVVRIAPSMLRVCRSRGKRRVLKRTFAPFGHGRGVIDVYFMILVTCSRFATKLS